MKKLDIIVELETMGTAIMELLIREGAVIKLKHLEVPENADHYKAEFLRDAHTWLEDVTKTQYAAARRIYAMQTPEMWARYKNWGIFDEHREVILLRKATNELRARVVSRARPDFFKKSKRDSKQHKTKAGLKAEDAQATA